jgi:tRNA pseudouridine65 synthase
MTSFLDTIRKKLTGDRIPATVRGCGMKVTAMTSPSPACPTVIHRDEGLVVVDKPSGMLVHRGWARDGQVLIDWVRSETGLAKVYPVHRLDRATSGVVLVGLDASTARELSALFEHHEVEKRYVALVRGRPPDSGLVDHPIPRGETGPRVPAQTSFRRIMTVDAEPRTLSIVEVIPRTGRLHQVRRHLKHIGHPVIGDATYGGGALNRAVRERYGLARLALHAAGVRFVDPRTSTELDLAAPMPSDLGLPLARMGFVEFADFPC